VGDADGTGSDAAASVEGERSDGDDDTLPERPYLVELLRPWVVGDRLERGLDSSYDGAAAADDAAAAGEEAAAAVEDTDVLRVAAPRIHPLRKRHSRHPNTSNGSSPKKQRLVLD
jgi:hypothetical protein